jgi:hypothetical protein
MKKHWILQNYDSDEIDEISRFAQVEKHLAAIIRSRGYVTPGEINRYLSAGLAFTHSPFS